MIDDLHSDKDSPNVKHEQVTKQHSGPRRQEEVATVEAGKSTNPTEEGEETDMEKMTEQKSPSILHREGPAGR